MAIRWSKGLSAGLLLDGVKRANGWNRVKLWERTCSRMRWVSNASGG